MTSQEIHYRQICYLVLENRPSRDTVLFLLLGFRSTIEAYLNLNLANVPNLAHLFSANSKRTS